MLNVGDWARLYDLTAKPWLIVGKGPTFGKYKPAFADTHNVLALNHVASQIPCHAALMMDLDVLKTHGEMIAQRAGFVILPWRPHVGFRPTQTTLADLIQESALLKRLSDEGRLVTFNAETASGLPLLADAPTIGIKYFSAEAALNLLVESGVTNIRTLGVDGGAKYSPAFADLNEVTLLANGRNNFDLQFQRFATTLQKRPDIVFGPLNVQTPVRIFVGADSTQILGARVLEYSIRRHASLSVKVEIINNDGLPVPKDPKKRARTGFSFSRFKIPELCQYRGRAIYLDADMQVFVDIKDLWTRDLGDAWLLNSTGEAGGKRTPQYSVMLLDCARLGWNARALVAELDAGKYDYAQLMSEFAMMPSDKKQSWLEFEWNSLETYEAGRTKLLHYTDMPTQPWVSDKNKNADVWYAELRSAVADGFVTMGEIHAEIAKGHISPLLPQWAGLEAYPGSEALAAKWVPPFRRFEQMASPAG